MVSLMLTMRFHSKINAVKQLVESGELGEINNVYFGGQHPLMYGRRPMWYFEEGKHGGVINDIAIHGIDILSYALGLSVKEVMASRCWNKYAEQAPNFKDSAQFMLTGEKGAGIIADVSYSILDGIEFGLPYYWKFYVWGTKGTLSFSLNEPMSVYYVKGDPNPKILEEKELEIDYLTDVYHMLHGEASIVKMADVFSATRTTLEIQTYADEMA